jgi:ATPase subunit of ABC transporter with duplicated ATPase domains
LDVASREWVECAIEDYEGTLLFVSHDRYFVDKFATRVWELEDGKIRDFPYGYAKYRSVKEHEAMPVASPEKKKEKPVKPVGSKELEKTVRRLEREISAREEKLKELDAAMEAASANYQEYLRLTEERQAQEAELEDLMLQWEEAAGQLE